jgi:hypothetical protein
MRHIATALLVGCFWLVAPLNAFSANSASQLNLASADWSEKASPNLATEPPSKEAVKHFINAVTSDDELDEEVCSFRFANLQHGKNLSLVVGAASSGREPCDEVYIVDKVPSGFDVSLGAPSVFDDLGAGSIGPGTDVSGSIKNIQGKVVYVMDFDLGTIKGQCYANWPVIYAWSGTSYKNESDRFKGFYRARLDRIKKTISDISTKRNTEDGNQQECLLAEQAQIERFLGISSDALLNQAVRLRSSNNPAKRQFAADLFSVVGPQAGRKYLGMLAKDSDRNVSDEAKYYLLGPSWKGPIRPPDDLDPPAGPQI